MSEIQREALRLMDATNQGAVFVGGFGWVFPTHIRNDHNRIGDTYARVIAAKVVKQIGWKANA